MWMSSEPIDLWKWGATQPPLVQTNIWNKTQTRFVPRGFWYAIAYGDREFLHILNLGSIIWVGWHY